MKFQKCFFCNKLAPTPIHVTEIDGDNVQSVDLCTKCAKEYMESLEHSQSPPKKQEIDLSHITTPEQLLEVFVGPQKHKKKYPPKDPCTCGMTLEEFDHVGRFGCPNCYSHFHELMEYVVLPYHGATEHVGKRPKYLAEHEAEKDPKEKLKLLKLRLAQAIELEEYERAAVLNEEIKQFTQSLPLVSEDQ